jgi:hypothetical protein
MTLKKTLAAALIAASGGMFASTALAQIQDTEPPSHGAAPTPQSVDSEGVRTSANIARGALDICHIDRAKVEAFKAAARKNFPAAPDFDGAWKLGYTEAQSAVDRFAQLKATRPADYKSQIAQACPPLERGIDEVTRGQ